MVLQKVKRRFDRYFFQHTGGHGVQRAFHRVLQRVKLPVAHLLAIVDRPRLAINITGRRIRDHGGPIVKIIFDRRRINAQRFDRRTRLPLGRNRAVKAAVLLLLSQPANNADNAAFIIHHCHCGLNALVGNCFTVIKHIFHGGLHVRIHGGINF